jgi:hypothetical protein
MTLSESRLCKVGRLEDQRMWNIWLSENWQGKLKYSEKTRRSATFPSEIPQDLT